MFSKKNLFVTKNVTHAPNHNVLSCYCKNQTENLTILDMFFDKAQNYTFQDSSTEKPATFPICEGYLSAQKAAIIFRSLAIILLTLTGHKVRLIVEETVENVGYGDITGKSIYVMKVVFYCYIYNFAILLLMNNANLTSQHLTWLSWIPIGNSGMFTDFTTKFYGLMGDLFVLLLLFNVFFQILFEVFIQIMVKIRAMVDSRGCTFEGRKYETKCESIDSYMSVHGGLTFHRHWRYGQVLTLVYMCMLFGAAIPILFPVTCLSLYIYFHEQIILIFKFYDVPPKHSAGINIEFI